MLRHPLRVFFIVLLALVIAWNFPISNSLSRIAIAGLAASGWLLLLAVLWRRKVPRFSLLTVTAVIGAFLLFPSKRMPSAESLRPAYVAALQRYTGVRYVWGGESWTGIDCSGLIRRAMVDALVGTGFRTGSPEAVRQGIGVWWHDNTAAGLADNSTGTTTALRTIPSIAREPASSLLPGDLAIAKSGIHILAYLGEGRWIDADPGAGKVRVSTAASTENVWLADPMRIARWNCLAN